MLPYRVIPCLLLKNAGLVKTVQFKNPRYVGDPINAVRIFNEKEVDELVFLDITATKEGRKPNLKVIKEIAEECFMPLGYGGGIRDIDVAKEVLAVGVEKIIINTHAAEDISFIEKAAKLFGNQSVVVSIDVKRNWLGKYAVFTCSGQKMIGQDPISYAKDLENAGAGEILLTSIDREGTFKGYDIDLIRSVVSAVNVPVVASGGAGNIADIERARKEAGATAVAAGSIFVFHGRQKAVLINYPEAGELKNVFTI